MQPDVLLADEPTGDLDEHTADTLHALLTEMHRERGLTSLIATHNPRLAAACHRVFRLEDGRLKEETDLRRVKGDEINSQLPTSNSQGASFEEPGESPGN
jgi:ABC-type lipoprotein export system ATPase subunit